MSIEFLFVGICCEIYFDSVNGMKEIYNGAYSLDFLFKVLNYARGFHLS
jgi:hypothetical protein